MVVWERVWDFEDLVTEVVVVVVVVVGRSMSIFVDILVVYLGLLVVFVGRVDFLSGLVGGPRDFVEGCGSNWVSVDERSVN